MKIRILCVGKLREQYWIKAADEYIKRLGRYCKLTVLEIKGEKLPENASASVKEKGKIAEGCRILSRLGVNDYVIALDIEGTAMSTLKLSERIEQLAVSGVKEAVFIIGGSNGLSDRVVLRADLRLSFSKMTYPHQLMRIILLEQIYRCYKILKNETYHK